VNPPSLTVGDHRLRLPAGWSRGDGGLRPLWHAASGWGKAHPRDLQNPAAAKRNLARLLFAWRTQTLDRLLGPGNGHKAPHPSDGQAIPGTPCSAGGTSSTRRFVTGTRQRFSSRLAAFDDDPNLLRRVRLARDPVDHPDGGVDAFLLLAILPRLAEAGPRSVTQQIAPGPATGDWPGFA
jgi:hypothetical protein